MTTLAGPFRVSTGAPFDGAVLFSFLRRWAVPGMEVSDHGDAGLRYARAMRLDHGPGLVRLTWTGQELWAELRVADADQEQAQTKIVALCDLQADSVTIDTHLRRDPHLAAAVDAAPGLRIPGTSDPHELAFGVLISQQISMAAAVTCSAKITARWGDDLPDPGFGLTRLFPTARTLAAVDPAELPMPRARGRAVVALAGALDSGAVDLSGATPLVPTRAALMAQSGVGPWTADSIALRALGDRDILLTTDLVIRRELLARGVTDPTAWSPYRSYATIHLWRPYVL